MSAGLLELRDIFQRKRKPAVDGFQKWAGRTLRVMGSFRRKERQGRRSCLDTYFVRLRCQKYFFPSSIVLLSYYSLG